MIWILIDGPKRGSVIDLPDDTTYLETVEDVPPETILHSILAPKPQKRLFTYWPWKYIGGAWLATIQLDGDAREKRLLEVLWEGLASEAVRKEGVEPEEKRGLFSVFLDRCPKHVQEAFGRTNKDEEGEEESGK